MHNSGNGHKPMDGAGGGSGGWVMRQARLEMGPLLLERVFGAGPRGEVWLEVGSEVGLGAVLRGEMLEAGASSCVELGVGRGDVRAC